MKKTISILATLAVASAIFITGCTHSAPSKNAVVDSEMVTITSETSKLSYDMEVGKYEVTRAWLKSVLGDAADVSTQWKGTASEGDARPADNVTKKLAAEFCNKLSEDAGLTPYYTISGDTVTVANAEGKGYRLPTKAEWETLAKGGQDVLYAGTNGAYTKNQATWSGTDSMINFTVYVLEENGERTPVEKSESIANVGDPVLADYAWTKYNVATGTVANPDILRSVYDRMKNETASADNNWLYINYQTSDGKFWQSNPSGYSRAVAAIDSPDYGTHAVGKKFPNAFKLYDMTGNVSELVEEGSAVGGDVRSNTSKIYIGHASYDAKVTGFRVVRTK